MFSQVLRRSDERLSELQCCKQDGSPCDCTTSLHEDYTARPDSYDCEKKMSTYVLRYGASYASEIYHYLVASNFKNKINTTRPLKIFSLGCGFSPDYFAIKKYFENNNIELPVQYFGVDKSTCWQFSRPSTEECTYYSADITSPFNFIEPDVVVVSKVFSTLHRNSPTAAQGFLGNLQSAVNNSFKPGTILIFADVNLNDFGRDIFHQSVSAYLPNYAQYYFDGYTGNNWTRIEQDELAFDIPDGLSVAPLKSVRKTVIFEYRK